MSHEFFFGPVHLVGHLRQECATTIALLDINAVPMQFKLVETLDATHGREHGDLDVEVVQLVASDWHKPWVLKGCRPRHLCYDLMQRIVLAKMSNAATQMAVFMQ